MKAPKFQKGNKYSFYENPYEIFEYIDDDGDGARFIEYRLEPSDGSLEEIGEITFDAYQITRLEEITFPETPETLQELTGQESGIVIYTSDEMIVCNWSQLGAHEMPKVFAGIEILGWEDEDNVFADADHAETNDFRPLLEGKNLIWDANGDIAAIENGTYFWGDDFRATVWTLTDGTIIIAPDMWN